MSDSGWRYAQALMASGMFPTDTGYMGPGTARVEPDKSYDVSPIMDLGRLDESSTPVQSNEQQQWWTMYDALRRSGASQAVLDYHISQNPQVRIADRWQQESQQAPSDADVITRAMMARQRGGNR